MSTGQEMKQLMFEAKAAFSTACMDLEPFGDDIMELAHKIDRFPESIRSATDEELGVIARSIEFAQVFVLLARVHGVRNALMSLNSENN